MTIDLKAVKDYVALAEKLRQHPIFASLRDGVMWSLIPVGVAMVPLYFALAGERNWDLRVMDVYLAALGVMGPSCALLVGQFLARSYKERSFAGAVALAVYLSLLPFWPHTLPGVVSVLRDTFTSGPFVGFVLSLSLGGGVIWLRKKWPSIGFGSEALGLLAGFFLIFFLRLNDFEIHRAIRVAIGRHISTADALGAAIFIIFSMNLLWFFGLQGSAIIGSFITGVYAQMAYENMQAAATGHVLPHLVTLPFLNYVFIGGAGTTLTLPFFMVFSKSKRIKILGSVSVLPVFFNTNETLIYLMPLIFNMDLAIPYLLGPVFTVVSTYYAIKLGWMPNFSYYIPGIYYLPSPIMGIVATTPGFAIPRSFHDLQNFLQAVLSSGSWRSGVISLFQIFILALFYYPFYKAFEKKLLEEERKKEESGCSVGASMGLANPRWSQESLPS